MTDNNQTPLATFNKEYNFKTVKNTDSKYKDTVKLFDTNGIKYSASKVGDVDGIMRESVTVALPVISLADLIAHDKSFTDNLMNDLVAATAKKMFIDKGLPVGEITLANIVTENTAKKRETIDKSLFTDLAEYVGDVMRLNEKAEGSIALVQSLIKGRFTAMSLAKHIRAEKSFPVALAGIKDYIEDLAAQGQEEPTADLTAEEIEQSAVSAASYMVVYNALETNFKSFLDSQASEDEELDELSM